MAGLTPDTSNSPWVSYAAHDGVGVITLNRPKVNAYDIGLMSQLVRCVTEAQDDPDASVVIVSSALPNVFCVGADIKAWGSNDTKANRQLVDTARTAANAIAQSPKLFIAAINGHALGGGLELAMACDLRFAAKGKYQLGLPEVKLGLMPGNGGTQRLLRLVGSGRALRLMASGESIGPDDALAMGLVDRVLPAETLMAETGDYARQLAAGATQAMGAIKRAVTEGAGLPLEDALALEARLVETLYDAPEAVEGLKAYQEKRLPRFRRS